MNAAADHSPVAHGRSAPPALASARAGETSPGARSGADRAREADAKRLAAIRARFEALGAADWQLGADEAGMLVDSSLAGDRVLLVRFGPHATSDEMQFLADAKADVGFLLSLVDRAVRVLRESSPAQRGRGTGEAGGGGVPLVPSGHSPRERGEIASGPPNYAAEAAIKCGEPAFRVFLEERHGLTRPLTDARVAQKLRSLLGVTTRRDLNQDEKAAARWKAIRSEFMAWRKEGR